jgi:hypothetical protein
MQCNDMASVVAGSHGFVVVMVVVADIEEKQSR